MDETLPDSTTLDQWETRRNDNEKVLHIAQNPGLKP